MSTSTLAGQAKTFILAVQFLGGITQGLCVRNDEAGGNEARTSSPAAGNVPGKQQRRTLAMATAVAVTEASAVAHALAFPVVSHAVDVSAMARAHASARPRATLSATERTSDPPHPMLAASAAASDNRDQGLVPEMSQCCPKPDVAVHV